MRYLTGGQFSLCDRHTTGNPEGKEILCLRRGCVNSALLSSRRYAVRRENPAFPGLLLFSLWRFDGIIVSESMHRVTEIEDLESSLV